MPPPSTPRAEGDKPPGQPVSDTQCDSQCRGGVASKERNDEEQTAGKSKESDSSSEYSSEYSDYSDPSSSEEEPTPHLQTHAEVKTTKSTPREEGRH